MPDGVPVWWVEESWFFKPEHTEFREATLAWLRSLGLDPNHLAPRAAVVPFNGAYELHVDEVVRDLVSGRDRADPLSYDQNLLTARRIVPVEADTWPAMPPVAELVA